MESVPLVRRIYLATEKQLFTIFRWIHYGNSTPTLLFVLAQWLVITLQMCRFIGDTYVIYSVSTECVG